MIDFRYHLVSLVSVFMALAIGIVLGAGPLKEAIGDQLSNQVEQLRADTSDLQQAVDNREAQLADRDAFIEAVTGSLTAGQIGGSSVVLVLLPGADGALADSLAQTLTAAGASVTGRVTLLERWTDPEQQAFRSSLSSQLVQHVEPRPSAGAGAVGELAAVLARAVVTGDAAAAGQGDPQASTVLAGLRAGELLVTDGDPALLATTAVVLTGPPEAAPGADDQAWAAADEASSTALAAALDAASSGAVVAGPTSSATQAAGLIAVLRSDRGAPGLSTVDAADTATGPPTLVLALREQLAGGAGHYGVADDATAVLPPALAGADADG